jgi:predicted metal-dependent phosphotriesterase family hydrolase
VTGQVRTVLGDVPASALGRTDYHEHLFQVTPLLPGDELDDDDRSGAEAGLLHAAGIDAMVEATPTGLGRDPERRGRYVAYGDMPGLAYLPARFVPRLAREGGPDLVRTVLVANPARLLAWSGP